MKKMIVIALCLLLTGCNQNIVSSSSIEEHLVLAQEKTLFASNYNKKYYSYYLEPCIGRVNSDETSNTFNYNGVTFVMNLNVASILQEAYYSEEEVSSAYSDLKDATYKMEGTFTTKDSTESYLLEIKELDNSYIMYLQAGCVEFFCVAYVTDLPKIAEKMMYMARTVSIDKEKVKRDFSLRKDITYTAKKIELFQNLVPEQGSIEELFETNRNTTEQDQNDNSD